MTDDEKLGLYKEPMQETLEEAAERLLYKEGIKLHPSGLETYLKGNVINAMVEMAKWQQERSYSEEDMREAFIAGGNSQIEEDDAYGSRYLKYMEKWFEKFKNK